MPDSGDDIMWSGKRRVTPAEEDQVRALHAQDLSRNEIARRLNRSAQTISRIAKDLGLSFHRGSAPGLKEATEARKADARARRAALALDLLDDITLIREQLRGAVMAYQVGGKDNTLSYGEVPRPSPRDLMHLSAAVGNLTDRHIRLAEHDADPGIDAAKSMLGALAAGLGAAYDQLNQTDGG